MLTLTAWLFDEISSVSGYAGCQAVTTALDHAMICDPRFLLELCSELNQLMCENVNAVPSMDYALLLSHVEKTGSMPGTQNDNHSSAYPPSQLAAVKAFPEWHFLLIVTGAH
eukprot:TRINITY_DN11357_c0_g1_i1.p1 TRINITY_DN11357_c0_g1~~TRINITY_DN11357_c0_g1_i1.p1  ORF type:complete len:112 (+),score=5.79 TRINITY_DN11357_c0_g1_i1:639-974(+)